MLTLNRLPDTPLSAVCKVAERIRKTVEDETKVTISLGVASYQAEMKEDDLIKKADDALYVAKQKGRNRIEVKE
jgi:diguanylate cyclase (GGDEF)-like protein